MVQAAKRVKGDTGIGIALKTLEKTVLQVLCNEGVNMTKRCKKCKVPLEGFLYRMIAAKIFSLRPSTKDPELCNKCEDKKGTLWATEARA